MTSRKVTSLIPAVLATLTSNSAWAFVSAQGAPSPASSPKTVVRLEPIHNVVIALPEAVNPVSGGTDASRFDFGPNLQAALGTQMQNGHYILDEPKVLGNGSDSPEAAKKLSQPPRSDSPIQWDGSSVVPAASFKFYIDALVFRSGDHGDSMFYGFDERFRTPFNDGTTSSSNEFPLSLVQFQHWFDRSFQDRGTAPLDSWSGLDLGQNFSLNAFVAWIDLKHAVYHSEIRMRIEMNAPLVGRHEVKPVQVKGAGFYFDIVGGYEQYSAGIGLARTDAMKAAFDQAFSSAYSVIDAWTKDLPMTARLYGYASDQQIFLNTGINSNIAVGTKYFARNQPGLVFEVVDNVPASGSLARLVSGSLDQVHPGMILIEQKGGASGAASQAKIEAGSARSLLSDEPTPVAAEKISLPAQTLPKSNFPTNWVPQQSDFTSLLNSVFAVPLLPYRIWRYFQYDQDYFGPDSQNLPQDSLAPTEVSDAVARDVPTPNLPLGAEDWASGYKTEPWAKQIGLDRALPMTEEGPVVAVIDTGVDYNHPALNERIWKNPAPFKDPNGNEDLYGWDFISGDSRPYDDNYHGTEVASVIVGIAPLVQIMPLKIFNPYGITSSAAVFGAFQYAVDHGAKIIVAAWASQKPTQTILAALRYAHDHGVLVITSAGDRGDDLRKSPSYPVRLSPKLDNVLAVTGVDLKDALVSQYKFYANYDPESVGIAAPGLNILAAQPRGHTFRDTTTSLAAALVAGAVSRNWAASQGKGTYLDWIQEVKAQSDFVPGLVNAVQGGLRLRIK